MSMWGVDWFLRWTVGWFGLVWFLFVEERLLITKKHSQHHEPSHWSHWLSCFPDFAYKLSGLQSAEPNDPALQFFFQLCHLLKKQHPCPQTTWLKQPFNGRCLDGFWVAILPSPKQEDFKGCWGRSGQIIRFHQPRFPWNLRRFPLLFTTIWGSHQTRVFGRQRIWHWGLVARWHAVSFHFKIFRFYVCLFTGGCSTKTINYQILQGVLVSKASFSSSYMSTFLKMPLFLKNKCQIPPVPLDHKITSKRFLKSQASAHRPKQSNWNQAHPRTCWDAMHLSWLVNQPPLTYPPSEIRVDVPASYDMMENHVR